MKKDVFFFGVMYVVAAVIGLLLIVREVRDFRRIRDESKKARKD